MESISNMNSSSDLKSLLKAEKAVLGIWWIIPFAGNLTKQPYFEGIELLGR